MITIDLKQYLEVYIDESRDHLDSLNQCILNLEKEPQNIDTVGEIFRSAHTLKGMAGTMGFEKTSVLTHEMENALALIRSGQLVVTGGVVDVLFECLDTLETLINSVAEHSKEADIEIGPLIKKLKGIDKIVETGRETKTSGLKSQGLNEYEGRLLKEAGKLNLNTFEVKVKLQNNCLLKSARAFLIFKNLEKHGEIIKTIPTVEEIEDEKFEDEIILYVVTRDDKDMITNEILSISEIEAVEVLHINCTVASGKTADKLTPMFKNEDDALQAKNNTPGLSHKVGKTVRVDINRLDNLMNLVSELIIIKTRLEGIGISGDNKDSDLFEAVEYLERITTSLHDAVMKVRMVPIEQVFNRFPRMVRDIAKELNKQIAFQVEGQETELDRTVIDEIGEPLIHILRNAADHGIETPEERESAGKPAEGRISLKAYHDGNNVVIEVEDDGKGIDLKKVAEKAVKLGIVAEPAAKTLKTEELVEFLFRPGFSTADRVTDISGRGVGMDVVKNKVESLGGGIEVKTRKGIGSCFRIRLPLTLAIIQALMVGVGNEKFAIPLSTIKETVMIPKDKINLMHKREVTLLRGNVLPLTRLCDVLEIESNKSDEEELTVVIVKKGESLTGLIVDTLIGQQEIVIKSLGRFLNNIKHIAGATILGDGQVALILDSNAIA